MSGPIVEWVEVAPRDGLQSWPDTIPTPMKVRLITRLLDCGFRRVEATSMVSSSAIPQLADAEQVLEALQDRMSNLRVLVPNVKGMERALRAGVRQVAVTVGATDAYNRQNLNRSVDETLSEIRQVVEMAGSEVQVDASVSVAFGCPYDGPVPIDRVLDVCRTLVDHGIQEISLGDTIGIANPAQVEEVFQAARDAIPHLRWGAHFHDTRGMALANILSALETGISLFEGSLGGIGGSPAAPGTAGNVCSEDALYMLDAMGIRTGIDVPRLITVAREAEQILGKPLPGRVHVAPEAEPRRVPA